MAGPLSMCFLLLVALKIRHLFPSWSVTNNKQDFFFYSFWWNILLHVLKKKTWPRPALLKICFGGSESENNGTNTLVSLHRYEIYGIWPSPFVRFDTLCMPSSPAYPQQLRAETTPQWWGPCWTALKRHHISDQQHAAPKTSCFNWERSVMGTSTSL